MTRESWDEYFIKIAHSAATRSTCPRLHVGCVISDHHNRIVSTGYNGSAPGEPHCCDVGCDIFLGNCKRTRHAERNAIDQTSWWKRRGGTLYCTDVPCPECAERILHAGVIEVVYDRSYRDYDGETVAYLTEHGIACRKLEKERVLLAIPG